MCVKWCTNGLWKVAILTKILTPKGATVHKPLKVKVIGQRSMSPGQKRFSGLQIVDEAWYRRLICQGRDWAILLYKYNIGCMRFYTFYCTFCVLLCLCPKLITFPLSFLSNSNTIFAQSTTTCFLFATPLQGIIDFGTYYHLHLLGYINWRIVVFCFF